MNNRVLHGTFILHMKVCQYLESLMTPKKTRSGRGVRYTVMVWTRSYSAQPLPTLSVETIACDEHLHSGTLTDATGPRPALPRHRDRSNIAQAHYDYSKSAYPPVTPSRKCRSKLLILRKVGGREPSTDAAPGLVAI
jgi:hypothetical protein